MEKQPNYEEIYKEFDALLIRTNTRSKEMLKDDVSYIQLDYLDLDKVYEDFENESNSYMGFCCSYSENNSYDKM